MKKTALLAISVLTTISAVSFPLTVKAFSVNELQTFRQNCNVIITGEENCSTIQEQLNQAGINFGRLNQENCPVQETPELCAPETQTPEICIPETSVPEEAPEIPVQEAPAPEVTEAPVPEAPVIETPAPEAPVAETPAPEVPQTGNESDKELTFAERVVELVNKERTARGLAPLTLDKTVAAAALVRAKETETSFSHTRPNGSSFTTALKEQGVQYMGAGENIAWGQKSPEQVMQGWMNSAGHKANILNPDFTKIGVGHYQNSQGVQYWTQLFTY